MPYPNEHSCRLEPPGSFIRFRRINNFQNSGYDVIMGFRRDGSSAIQAIRYPTGKWTEVKARNHCQDKGGEFHAASQAAQAVEGLAVTYAARFDQIVDGARTFIKIHAIDLTRCKNKWRVTKEAMQKAARSILDAKLIGPPPPGEQGNVVVESPACHRGVWKDVGRFLSYSQNGVTFGLGEVTEPYAAENIRSGKWRATSPKILINAQRHENGEIVVSDYKFDHILFVDNPGFTNAGVVQVCDSPEQCGLAGNCLAGAIETALAGVHLITIEDQELSALEKAIETARGILQSVEKRLEILVYGGPEEENDFTVAAQKAKTDAEMMALGLHPENKSNNENRMEIDPSDHSPSQEGGCTNLTGENEGSQKCIAEMQEKVKALGAKVETLEKTNADLLKANEDITAVNKQLMDDKKTREDAEHLAFVNAVVDLRVKAGLVKEEERAKAVEVFSKMSNDALSLMKSDLERQVNAVAASAEAAKAKAKFQPQGGKSDSGFTVGWWNSAEKKWVV